MAARARADIERVRDQKIASQLRATSTAIKELLLPDANTIVFKVESPNPVLFDMLVHLVMLDKATATDLEGAKQVIGTGPFKWQEYVPGNKVVLVRNDKYWQAGRPYLDQVEVQIVDDKQSMVLSVESGQRDLAWQVLPQDLGRFKGHPQVVPLVSAAGSQFYYIGAVATAEGVSDKRIRQAFNTAIDRKRIVDTQIFGLVEPQALPWPKSSPAYSAEIDKTVAFDLNKAKQQFAAAGVAAGTTLIVEANAQDPLNAKIAQIVQADLATIDIKLDLQSIENSVFQQRLNASRFKQLFANTMGGTQGTPVNFFIQAFPVRVSGNASKFSTPEYLDLVKQMQAEPDAAKLKALYDRMNTLLVDEAFNMPICPAPQGWVHNKAVKGFDYNLGNYVYLENVWLDR